MQPQSQLLIHPHPSAGRRLRARCLEGLCVACAVAATGVLLAIFLYLAHKGLGAIDFHFFTQTPKPVGEAGGGVANAITGTLLIVTVAAAIAVPLGIAAGTYLAEFGRGRFADLVRLITDVLTGVPSIVVGILAYELVVLRMGRFSAFAGGVALAALMLPPIVRTTEEILRMAPREQTEAALALGAPRSRTVLGIVYPSVAGGLITGVLLALARAAGETAPLLFTAFGNTFWNLAPDQPTAALPLQIYQYAISPYADWQRQAWAAAFVLVLLVLIINAAARTLTGTQRRW